MTLPRATETARFLVSRHLGPGQRAVDATVGNGHDTRFLADRVGPEGRVDGFDIQPEAIARSGTRLAGLPQVFLHPVGHEFLGGIVSPGVTAVMFNLGYLPGGNKGIVTRPGTTLAALAAALGLLEENGILTTVVYPRHPGGAEEAEAVEQWFQDLDPMRFRTLRCGPVTGEERSTSPFLLAVSPRRRGRLES